jgi:hypothetical protein
MCAFGTFFPVWVIFTKKNLATLVVDSVVPSGGFGRLPEVEIRDLAPISKQLSALKKVLTGL